jgi:hypothetical protein
VSLPLLTFVFGFAANFVWELAHTHCYVGLPESTSGKIFICILATIADALYISAVYMAGRLVANYDNWTSQLNRRRLTAIVGTGMMTAVLVEMLALRTGFWGYSNLMPVVPILRVGLWPTLQLPMISLVVFAVVGRIGTLLEQSFPRPQSLS